MVGSLRPQPVLIEIPSEEELEERGRRLRAELAAKYPPTPPPPKQPTRRLMGLLIAAIIFAGLVAISPWMGESNSPGGVDPHDPYQARDRCELLDAAEGALSQYPDEKDPDVSAALAALRRAQGRCTP